MLATLKSIARLIVESFGPGSAEVVIHDLADLEHSIVWIEGDVTHRHVGGGMTDLGLSVIQSGQFEDLYNYRTYLPDGHTLKSSSVFLRDSDGKVWGTFCVNYDVTLLLQLQRFLEPPVEQRNGASPIKETFTDNIEDTLRRLLAESAGQMGKFINLMDHGERVRLIRLLDQKGAFQVRGAVPVLARALGVSRYTIYNLRAESRADSATRVESPEPASI
jgi:predicted transcriptional regulator YheO